MCSWSSMNTVANAVSNFSGRQPWVFLQVKFAKSAAIVIVRIEVEKPICVELFDNVPQLGRFTLRDEGRTIAIGKIVKLPKSLKGESAPDAK